MNIINLRERFGRRFKMDWDPAYYAQYGRHARVADPDYQIIPGILGHVYAWDGTTLAASTNTSGSTAARLKTLAGVKVWQDGTDGCTVLFPVEVFDQVAELLKLRRRRRVTDEERKRLSELGHQTRFLPRQHGVQSDLEARPGVPRAQPDPKHVPGVAVAISRSKRKSAATARRATA